ncbi:hypothetical protein ACFUVV_18440 [Streptomyces sp. NPDC057376]|uniref:hypothetical protein n=1 Tax=unclassified Streptomyces TaxID=2593676 RepID=UPI00363EAB6D
MAVDPSFCKSYISEEIRDEGREQGRVQQGAQDVLLVLEQRGLAVSDDVPAPAAQVSGAGRRTGRS